MTATFYYDLGLSIGLGLAVAVILWLLRGHDSVRRIRFSVLSVTVAFGVCLILLGAGFSSDETINKIVIAATILLVVNLGLQFIDLLLWQYLSSRQRSIPIPRLLVDIFNAVVLISITLGILNRLFDIDLNALLVTSTVASAVIGLALQDTLGNLIAGIALQMDRPFDVGDWIHVDDQEGEVMQMNWRTIVLRTIDRNAVILSNANVVRQDVINYSRPTPLQRFHVKVGMSYGDPPSKVKQALLEAAKHAEGVRADPPPDVLITDYGDSAIVYDIRYWIDDYSRAPDIRDEVLTHVWYSIRREDMSVPFPIRDVNLRQIPENHEARIQQKLRHDIFTHLRPLSVFAPLSDEQIDGLAREAELHRYMAGEIIVRQGEAGDSLFVIKTGSVRVDVQDSEGRIVTVAKRGPDDFFGEMSLLTGENRSASIIAETETEVVSVCKDDLAQVISGDLGRLEALSKAVEARMRESHEKITAASDAEAQTEPDKGSDLLTRIQAFLGFGPS